MEITKMAKAITLAVGCLYSFNSQAVIATSNKKIANKTILRVDDTNFGKQERIMMFNQVVNESLESLEKLYSISSKAYAELTKAQKMSIENVTWISFKQGYFNFKDSVEPLTVIRKYIFESRDNSVDVGFNVDKFQELYVLSKRILRNLEVIHLMCVQQFKEQKTFESDIYLDGFYELAALSEKELVEI